MDRETLSNYGWVVIVVIILAIMIALATPFGNYIRDGVTIVVESFDGKLDSYATNATIGEKTDNESGPTTPQTNVPTKGQLINIDLDQTAGAESYRVIKVNGTKVELLEMPTTEHITEFGSSATYNGSTLDTYLNTTWYGNMNTTAKAAVVSQNISQDSWYTNKDGDPDYSGTYGTSNNAYIISKNSTTTAIGERNVYALSVQDVIDYLDVNSNGTMDNGELSMSIVNTMFFGSADVVSGRYPWLRSAHAGNFSRAWYVNGEFGRLNIYYDNISYCAARAALTIDLSKPGMSWVPAN